MQRFLCEECYKEKDYRNTEIEACGSEGWRNVRSTKGEKSLLAAFFTYARNDQILSLLTVQVLR